MSTHVRRSELRLALLLVSALSLCSCVRTVSLRGGAVQSLRAGQDDAVVLEPPLPVELGESSARLEASSLVRLTPWNRAPTRWIPAKSLRLAFDTLSWPGERGDRATLPLALLRSIEVSTFDPGLSMVFLLTALATAGAAFAYLPGDEGDGLEAERKLAERRAQDAVYASDVRSADHLFSERAVRASTLRFVLAQDLGGAALAKKVDLFSSTRFGLRFADFFEVSLGLRLRMPDVTLQGPFGPLQARTRTILPGFVSRVVFVGPFDPAHRVALVVGGEVGADEGVTGRVLGGVQVRLLGQLHVTALPFTVLFNANGVSWGFSVDTAWHF